MPIQANWLPLEMKLRTTTAVRFSNAMRCSICVLSIVCLFPAVAFEFRGGPHELVISEISDRTIRIQLLPIAPDGKTLPPKNTSALVPFASTELFRARELSSSKTIVAKKTRVTASAQPLSISYFREDGHPVQQLTFG